MNKKLFTVFLSMIALIIVILANVIFYKPPELNVDYINEEIFHGTEYIDEILLTSKGENYIACLCSVSESEMKLLILNNDKNFSLQYKYAFSLSALNSDSTNIMSDGVFSSNQNVRYNIYLDPDSDTVVVDGNSQPVNIVEYNGYSVGFWWYEVEQ